MKVFNLFKKKEKIIEENPGYDVQDLMKIPKKQRANAIRLFKEYQEGNVIRVANNIN